ncbi:MAG: hypothetical protein AAGK01_03690 [Pseudomonadota bacterium]
MTKLPQQFIEDRALRDSARKVFMADIEHARTAISGKGIAARVGSRVGDGARDVFEVARVHADDNRGILAALLGAILLFVARAPILEIFGITDAEDNEEGEPMENTGETAGDIAEEPEMLQDAEPVAHSSGDSDER